MIRGRIAVIAVEHYTVIICIIWASKFIIYCFIFRKLVTCTWWKKETLQNGTILHKEIWIFFNLKLLSIAEPDSEIPHAYKKTWMYGRREILFPGGVDTSHQRPAPRGRIEQLRPSPDSWVEMTEQTLQRVLSGRP